MKTRERGVAVSVVIPTCTDRRIRGFSVQELLAQLPHPCEVLLVVNSRDGRVLERARRLTRLHNEVSVLHWDRPLGKGGAILHGLHHSRGRVVGFVDDDIPFPPALITEQLIQPVLDGRLECAIASKWLGRQFHEVTTYTRRSKKLLSRGLNLVTRRLFGLPFADTQGGAKFFTRQVYEAIDTDFICRSFDFDVELLLRIAQAETKIEEVYLPPCKVEGSSFHLRHTARMSMNLVRLRLLNGDALGR